MLYNTYRNIINIVSRYDSLDYIGQVSSESKYIYSSYDLFFTDITFTDATKVFGGISNEFAEMSSKNQ